MYRLYEKEGKKVNPIEQRAKAQSPRTAVRALLDGPLLAAGSGARSRRRLATVVLTAAVALVLLVPVVAQAAFTRTFLRGIPTTNTYNAANCSDKPAGTGGCSTVGGTAVDGHDDLLWAENEGTGNTLSRFAPAYAPGDNKSLAPVSGFEGSDVLKNLAVEDASEDIYNLGNPRPGNDGEVVEVYDSSGAKLREWGSFSNARIAIDNSPVGSVKDLSACGTFPLSPSPAECFVYVTEWGFHGGVMRFNPKGEAEPFSFAKECDETPTCYVQGNKITGIPGDPEGVFGFEGLVGVAVDGEGNIFAANSAAGAVYEYSSSGKFVQAFELKNSEVPRLAGGLGEITNIAVDPVSDHVLASVAARQSGELGAVEEFDIATGKYVAEITEAGEGAPLKNPVAVSVDSHGDVYVTDEPGGVSSAAVVDVYENGHFVPTLTLGAATERAPTGATLNGTVDPEGFTLTECEFQYVPQAQFEAEKGAFTGVTAQEQAACVSATGSIAETGTTPVTGSATDLTAGTTYHYRLVAHSSGTLGGTAKTVALAFTAPGAPAIVSTSAANLSSAFAELHAEIAPHGVATTYRFEYLTAAAYTANGDSFSGTGSDAATSVPVSPESIGLGGPTGGAIESVVQHIGPLAAGSTYYYRVVADNAQGETAGAVCEGASGLSPACAFATLPPAGVGLPDERSYELVTPATKEGGSDMFALPETNGEFENKDRGFPAEDGGGFLLETFSPFGPFPAAGHSAYVFDRAKSSRGELEWGYKSLASSSLGVQSISEPAFDPADLSRVGVNDNIGSEITEEGGHGENLVGEPGGPYETLHVDPTTHKSGAGTGEEAEETQIVGGSRDLSHVVLESEPVDGNGDRACPGAEAVKRGSALCESAGGELKLVNVDNEGQLLGGCGASLGDGLVVKSGSPGSTYRAVSADGSRILFTVPAVFNRNGREYTGPGCWNGATKNAPELYMRSGGATVEISTPENGVEDPTGQHPAEYAGASENDSKVFFLTETELTEEAVQLGLHDRELYEYETETGKLTRISGGETGAAGALAAVTAISADGSAVYFLANGVLAANAGANGTHATPGGCVPHDADTNHQEGGLCNLYRYDTDTHTIVYIATVNDLAFSPGGGDATSQHIPTSRADWYTTPDGRYLLFKSNNALTNFNNAGSVCDIEVSGGRQLGPCAELYRYDAQAAENGEQPLVCVSCGAGGELPTGNARFSRSAIEGPATGPARAMSDNGAYAFFDTPTPLVSGATNESLNVYEWHEGTISLLDSGSEPGASYFLGYSPFVTPTGEGVEGGNVFIGTHDKLTVGTSNSVGNIYDARICRPEQGAPCIQPPVGETAQCEGSGCQNPPAAPIDSTPSSLTFSGPGNPTLPAAAIKTATKKATPRCKRPKKLVHGKCAKPKAKKKAKTKRAGNERRVGR
jgi:hypothetical protein